MVFGSIKFPLFRRAFSAKRGTLSSFIAFMRAPSRLRQKDQREHAQQQQAAHGEQLLVAASPVHPPIGIQPDQRFPHHFAQPVHQQDQSDEGGVHAQQDVIHRRDDYLREIAEALLRAAQTEGQFFPV